MSQINAFEILGATPSDDLDRLQELLDEKELLSEDPSAAQNAYGELTNPKKRLLHEITYIRADMFEGFYKLIFKEPEKPSTDDVADVLVEIGQWFEESDEDLFFEINECRNKSGFKPIEDESVLFQAIGIIALNLCKLICNVMGVNTRIARDYYVTLEIK